MTFSIDDGGDGGDGYAVDFLTMGVTTVAATPEQSTLFLAGGAMFSTVLFRRRR